MLTNGSSRRRRVKCDEGKPSCERCRKFGTDCDGYESKIKHRPSSLKPLSILPATVDIPGMTVSFGPRLDEAGGRYFRYFCEGVAGEITGPFKTSVWSRLIPQAAEAEPFIKHGIIALSALSKSRAVMNHDQSPGSTTLTNLHHKFAVKEYCKVLKGLREAMSPSGGNARTALLACLLAFCFEALQDDQTAASMHASGGVNLLYQYHNHRPTARDPDLPEAPSYCATQFSIEEDLHAAFSLLDLQAYPRRPINVHASFVQKINQALKLIPEQFTNLTTCRTYAQLIARRNFHWMHVTRSTLRSRTSFDKSNPNPAEEVAEMHFGHTLWVGDRPEAPAHLLAEREQCIADLGRWERASKNLFVATGYESLKWTGTRLEDFVVTNLLRLQALEQRVLLAQTFYPGATECDGFLAEFRDMVELSKVVYPHLVKGEGSLFHFNLGIVPALSQVGMLCREKEVRAAAIEMLLRKRGYREGLWDANAVGRLDECAMEMEEEWRGGGEIPGDRRVRLVTVAVVLRERRAVTVWKQRVGTDDESEVVERKREIKW